MKIFLCRYKENAALIAAAGIADARSAVVAALGNRWTPGTDDRKKIQCREVKDVFTRYEIEDGGPVLLQTTKG